MVCVVDAGRKGVARRRAENGAKGAGGVRRHADAGCQRAGRRRRPGGRGLGRRASERLELLFVSRRVSVAGLIGCLVLQAKH